MFVRIEQKNNQKKSDVLVDKMVFKCYNIIVASRGTEKRQITTKNFEKFQKKVLTKRKSCDIILKLL